MPWVESLTDPQELRRCIRDLVALSTLPSIWTSYNPQQIADSIAAALLSMLAADFVYISLPSGEREQITETIRVGKAIASNSGKMILTALRDAWLGQSEQTGVIANPFGEGAIRVASAPIGFRGDAVIVAGSQQPSFPTGGQRLLLSIGANGTTIALQRWSAETVEERFVSLVERSSDFVALRAWMARHTISIPPVSSSSV
jgi:hypothetical protein